MNIIFVCTGNTCRSPMAEKLAQKWLQENLPEAAVAVSSAGLAAFPGLPASEQSVQVMSEYGLDLSEHRSRMLDLQTARDADIIVTMTAGHKAALLDRLPEAAGKVFTLAELCGDHCREISDPYGQPVEVYRRTAAELWELIPPALHRILSEQK